MADLFGDFDSIYGDWLVSVDVIPMTGAKDSEGRWVTTPGTPVTIKVSRPQAFRGTIVDPGDDGQKIRVDLRMASADKTGLLKEGAHVVWDNNTHKIMRIESRTGFVVAYSRKIQSGEK